MNETTQYSESTADEERAIAKVIESIDGVSDRVIDGLNEEFGTATAIANASPNELQRVDGIGPVLARKIHRWTDIAAANVKGVKLGLGPKSYARGTEVEWR